MNLKMLILNFFTNFLKTDTTFVTKQEGLFKKAFLASENNNISKEYGEIKEKLYKDKIDQISKNKDILKQFYKKKF